MFGVLRESRCDEKEGNCGKRSHGACFFYFVIPSEAEESLTVSVFESMSGEKYFEMSPLRSTWHSRHMAQVTIETTKNGPYIVKGEVELMDIDGNKFPVEPRMALCRCGASTEKPFCDGTHSKIGFKAAEKAVPESKE
jgi:CDGSH-type Zn-finger protein